MITMFGNVLIFFRVRAGVKFTYTAHASKLQLVPKTCIIVCLSQKKTAIPNVFIKVKAIFDLKDLASENKVAKI